jgi:predicted phosphodiesterase
MISIVTSDFHINEHRRLDDTKALLEFILSEAFRIKPDYFVILGDIFDKRRPSPKEMRTFNQWVMRLQGAIGQEIIILEGNHDRDVGVSALSYLADLEIPGIRIVVPPYIFREFYFDHIEINGADAGNGYMLQNGVHCQDLINKHPVKVYALGHIHKPQTLRHDPLVFYAGSIDRINYGERYDIKFMYVFDNTDLITRIALPCRPMYQHDVNVSESGDFFAGPPDADYTGALVKLIFHGQKAALSKINSASIMNSFKQMGAKEISIIFDVQKETRVRNSIMKESISEAQALAEYFKDNPNKGFILSLGNKIIEEVRCG